MAQTVSMPVLGESVTEGTVTTWLKKVGDTVAIDEPLLEVSTDKVDTEIPSPVAGVLLNILVPEDETVDVGTPLAEVGEASEMGSSGTSPSAAPTDLPNPEIPSTVSTSADGSAQVEWSYPSVPPVPPKAEALAPESVNAFSAPAEVSFSSSESPVTSSQVSAGGGGSGEAIKMPVLGESVTEGTVISWLKKVGETVEVDEPLLEVSTDKVDTEVPSPIAGVISQIVVPEDETVEVGTILAYVGGSPVSSASATEQPGPTPVSAPAAPAPAPAAPPIPTPPTPPAVPSAPTPPAPPAPVAPTPASPSTKRRDNSQGEYATPIVRKLAAEKGVDLNQIQGTGVGGRIRKQDVLDAANLYHSAPNRISANRTVPAPPALPVPPVTPVAPAPPAVPIPPAPTANSSAPVTPTVPTSLGELDMARLAQLFTEVAKAFGQQGNPAPQPATGTPTAPSQIPPAPSAPTPPPVPSVPQAPSVPTPPVAPQAPAAPTPPSAPSVPATPAVPPVATAPAAPPASESASSGTAGGGEPIKMPALGESVTEGTVTTWLKKVGDTVALDEPLLEVSTDKVDTEIPSPIAGTITEIVVPEDETVEVGTILAYVK